MINRVIEICAQKKFLIFLFLAVAVLFGVESV